MPGIIKTIAKLIKHSQELCPLCESTCEWNTFHSKYDTTSHVGKCSTNDIQWCQIYETECNKIILSQIQIERDTVRYTVQHRHDVGLLYLMKGRGPNGTTTVELELPIIKNKIFNRKNCDQIVMIIDKFMNLT